MQSDSINSFITEGGCSFNSKDRNKREAVNRFKNEMLLITL